MGFTIPYQITKEPEKQVCKSVQLAERIINDPDDLDALIEFTANDKYLNSIFVDIKKEKRARKEYLKQRKIEHFVAALRDNKIFRETEEQNDVYLESGAKYYSVRYYINTKNGKKYLKK